MEAALRGIGAALQAFGERLTEAWTGLVGDQGSPASLLWLLAGLAALLVVLALLRRRRPRRLAVQPPQLLVTQGEVVPDEVTAPSLAVRRSRERAGDVFLSASGVLSMTVSNMSRYPVQLLEAALRSTPRGAPTVVDLGAVVPAMASAEVEARLPMALSTDGVMDLYCYAAAPKHKLYRHRVELVWEPWAERFKVAPMEQRADPVKRLASDEAQARFQMPSAPRSVREAQAAAADAREAAGPKAVASPSAAVPLTAAGPAGVPSVAGTGASRSARVPQDADPRSAAATRPPVRETVVRDARLGEPRLLGARPVGRGTPAPDAQPRPAAPMSTRVSPPSAPEFPRLDRSRPDAGEAAASFPRPGLVAAKVGPAVLAPSSSPTAEPSPGAESTGLAEAVPEPKLESKPEPRPEPMPEPRQEPKPGPVLEPALGPRPEARPEPQLGPKSDPQPDPKPDPQPDQDRPPARRTRLEFPEDF